MTWSGPVGAADLSGTGSRASVLQPAIIRCAALCCGCNRRERSCRSGAWNARRARNCRSTSGKGAWIVEKGKRRKSHLLRCVLGYSRKGYSEAVWRQDTETFLRAIGNAFRYFGGVTATVVIDNLKAGVIRADWYDPDLNPKLEEFARHYGTVILPCKPGMARHKGKVEAGVK